MSSRYGRYVLEPLVREDALLGVMEHGTVAVTRVPLTLEATAVSNASSRSRFDPAVLFAPIAVLVA